MSWGAGGYPLKLTIYFALVFNSHILTFLKLKAYFVMNP